MKFFYKGYNYSSRPCEHSVLACSGCAFNSDKGCGLLLSLKNKDTDYNEFVVDEAYNSCNKHNHIYKKVFDKSDCKRKVIRCFEEANTQTPK